MSLYGVRFTEPYQALLIIIGLLALILLNGRSGSSLESRVSLWDTTISITSSWLALVVILLIIGYATKTSFLFSRKTLFTWALTTPVLILAAQFEIYAVIDKFSQSSRVRRKAVVAGANQHGLLLAEKIRRNRQLGRSIEGVFEDHSYRVSWPAGSEQTTPATHRPGNRARRLVAAVTANLARRVGHQGDYAWQPNIQAATIWSRRP